MKNISKDQILTEGHHRRPESLGGTNSPANISYVEKKLHDAWARLVGNMNAYQICDFINYSEFKPKNVKIVCEFINGTPVTKKGGNNSTRESKVREAWKILFGNLSFTETIAYINNVWLDPSYHFYVEEIEENV